MSYNQDMKGAAPTYPQQDPSNPSNQTPYNLPYNAAAAYPQPAQYVPPPQQQGSPYAVAPGVQYPQGHQVQQQFVPGTQPQVYVGQPLPQVVVMGCPQGQHNFVTHYGPCGIIAAILLFPIGLIFLFVDQERRCTRCDARG